MSVREHKLKVGVSGVRGVVGEFLTPALTTALSQAFGTYVGRGRVIVGRDTRPSGEMILHAVRCGLLAAGCEVVDVGILPTPTIQVYVAATKAQGGIAITASHNPPEYNALKFFNAQGLFCNTYERGELIDLWHQSSFHHAQNDEMRGVTTELVAPKQLHFDRVLSHVDVERIRRRRFRVGLDAVNGAGSLPSVEFLTEYLNCELHAIAVDPTKPFPRVAEPRPDTLGDLSKLVRETGCDIGFAQDPDGDRLAVADETGRVLDNDDVLALAVDACLARLPGDVVVNLTTSSVIDDIAARHGRRVFRTPVGEANVVERMQRAKAVIGGEGSNGGIIFPAVQYCRDSYNGMAFLLDLMAASGEPVTKLAGRLPQYTRMAGSVAYQHGRLASLMQAVEDAFIAPHVDRSDGLKLIWPGHWIHVRSSNTEPILRFAVESTSEAEARALFERVKEFAA
ncbi:MAG: phosphoglucosamine mutase [Bryobacterales bacterium]|nr:phosphoglucosamine mutase [Bryobacterales bacterium]